MVSFGLRGNMIDKIYIYLYAIKYWLQNDDWEFAKEYAESIVKGFKK